jgi:hypothetical protein
MTGPEHYREGQRLLSMPVSVDPEDQGAVIALHLAAQAHFMAAQVAATVYAIPGAVSPEWSEAIA